MTSTRTSSAKEAHQTDNSVLLDHLPIAAVDLNGMPDETTRRLFEALRLEIRYDPNTASPGAASR